MKKNRLSLENFKAKAEKVESTAVLAKIQGGENDECHYCGPQEEVIIPEYIFKKG